MVEEVGEAPKEYKDSKTFFRAVRPSSRIIDNYSFHGDIETIFNMTRETENTWLFRRRFDVAAKRKVCRSEKSAICEFLEFVLKLKKPVVFISVDEETLSVVLNKCKEISKEKYEKLRGRIRGFTYWSRTLRKMSKSSVDLEEYNESSSEVCSAIAVAKTLRKAYIEVTNGSNLSYINVKNLKRPHRHTVKKDGKITIEISSTFRNAPSCIITGEKKEQVVIEDSSDDSDVEILPDEENSRPTEYIEEEIDSKLAYNQEDRVKGSTEAEEYFEVDENEQKLKATIESEDKNLEVITICENEILYYKFVNYKVQIDTQDGHQKCHFCGVYYSSSSLDQHYKASHKAYEWCQLNFPGTLAFKDLSGHIECCICKFAFKNIANHLRRDHKIANVKDFLDLIQQPYSPTLDLSVTPSLSSNSKKQRSFSSASRPQSVKNCVEKEEKKDGKFGSFIDYHIQEKGKNMQVCNFCGTPCTRKKLPRHYSRVHKAGAWSNLPFPGPKAYDRYPENDAVYICLICKLEENVPSNGLVFIDIAHHLQIFHKIPVQKLPDFLMKEKDQREKKVQTATVKISNIAGKLPPGEESKKRKCLDSGSGVWKQSRSSEMEKQLQKFQPKFAPTYPQPTPFNWPQPPNLFYVRVPPPHYGGPRMPQMQLTPRAPASRQWSGGGLLSFAQSHDQLFYPSPGDDGWRMWR